MNLQIDLILPNEQRSPSVMGLKSMMRISTVVVPVILALGLAHLFLGMMMVHRQTRSLERRWEQVEPLKTAALELRKEMAANESISKELAAWKASRVDWHRALQQVQQDVPPEVQLLTLTLTHKLGSMDNAVPARVFGLTLNGKAVCKQPEDAEENVKLLERRLDSEGFLGETASGAVIDDFGADPARGANKTDRVFLIICKFAARAFE